MEFKQAIHMEKNYAISDNENEEEEQKFDENSMLDFSTSLIIKANCLNDLTGLL